ncbi:hypothetical protein HYY71_03080, partial [Candidatus Woesearchaeota archaeon]|nr:hypothetical protein [Candidatus Woesearchaeota archaeon]
VKKRSDGGYEVETRKGAYIVKATYWPKTNLQTTIQDERLEVTVDYRGTGTFRKYDNRGLRDLPGMVLDEKGSYPNRKLTPEKIPQLAPEKQKNYKAEYEKALAILSQYLRRSGQTK